MGYRLHVSNESAFGNSILINVVKRSSLVKTKMIGTDRIKAARFDYSLYLCDAHFRAYRIPMEL
jgi:hypothetical protein